MKKNVFVVGIVSTALIIGFFLTSCAGSPSPDLGVYDASVSEDQQVTLEIAGGLKVVGFNGNQVSWAENDIAGAWRAQQRGSDYKTTITIPAGNHTLQADLYLWPYNSYPGIVGAARSGFVRQTGMKIDYEFKSGHTYFLRPVIYSRKTLFHKGNQAFEYYDGGTLYSQKQIYSFGPKPSGYISYDLQAIFDHAVLRVDDLGEGISTTSP